MKTDSLSKIVGAFALFLGVALPAEAQVGAEKASNTNIDSSEYVMVKRSDYSVNSSSSQNRQNERFSLALQPIGLTVLPIASFGATVGYFLNPDSVLQLEYTSGNIGLGFFDIKASTLGLNVKQFLGNSFYIKGGAAYRYITLDNLNCDGCDASIQWGSSSVLAGEVAIGNQWQWSSFTLGCDWIGAMIPVTSVNSANQEASGDNLSSSRRKSLNDAWQNVGQATSVSLLRFYLGASF